MKIRSTPILLFVLIALTGACTVVFGQAGGKLTKAPVDSRFKILSSDLGFADGPAHSSQFPVLFVYLRPGYRTPEKISACAQKIKGWYSKENGLIAVFADRRAIAKDRIFSAEYDSSMRTVRSIYAFSNSTGKETFKFFPDGMKLSDFENLGSDEEN